MRQLDPDEMILGLMVAKTVAAAVELGVVDLLAEHSQTSEQLAEGVQVHAPSLRRLLRALTGLGFVIETTPDRFELTETGGSLLAGVPGSKRHLMLARCRSGVLALLG